MTSVSEHSAEPAAQHEIDIHTTAGKLADLRKRAEETLHPVGEAAVEKTHAKGKLTARERIYALLDEGSFVELDALARHRSTNFGLEANRPLGDGVITGYGTIDGRDVCIFSQDATVFGGSLGEVYGEKIVKVQELAIKTGRPLIGINDGAGARIQEGVVSLGLYSKIFHNNILASGVIPQISLIMGAAAGGHVYSPALTDFVMLVDVPGFLPGTDQEYNGIIRRGAKLLYAYGEATVAKITVITRKAYGGAYCVMGSKEMGADVAVAWPTAQIAVMGASGAVGFVYRQQLSEAAKKGEDVDALRLELQQTYEDTLVNPYIAAERGYVDAVIPPSYTRGYVATALRLLERKITQIPPKKHGNIPL